MSTVTRNQFTQRFEGKSIDLKTADLTSAQRTALRRADTNGDGKLEGAGEINKAFTRLDDFDRNGSSTISSAQPPLHLVAACQAATASRMAAQAEASPMGPLRSTARRTPVSATSSPPVASPSMATPTTSAVAASARATCRPAATTSPAT